MTQTPGTTPRGIQYPRPENNIRTGQPNTAKLAQDLRSLASTTDSAITAESARTRNAITAEGVRNQNEAARLADQAKQSAAQEAISDADRKYGVLPGMVAQTEAHNTEQDVTLGSHETRLSAVETLGGLAPGEVSDATVASVVANPASQASVALRDTFDIRSANNTKNYEGTAQQRLEQALADEGVVQFDETVTHEGNIAGFWDRNIYGTGVIHLPNGSTFTPDPKPKEGHTIVNTVYLNADTGNADNDGLTPETPLDSVWSAYHKVLRNLTAQQAAGARWIINMAGTFTQNTPMMNNLPNFPYGLIFQGEPLVDGKPVTTMQYSGTGQQMGLYFEPGIDQVTVRHIHFRDYKVGFNGYGVIMKFGGKLNIQYCEYADNDRGVGAIQGTQFAIADSFFNPGHDTAIATEYNATGHVIRCVLDGGGTNGGVGGDANGIRVSRGVNAHIDYNEIRGYTRGLYVDMASRAAVPGNIFGRNETGVLVTSAAEWNNNDNIFEPTNTAHYRHEGAGREVGMHSSGSHKALEYRFFSADTLTAGPKASYVDLRSRALVYNTGSAAFPEKWFINPGKTIRFNISGELVSANGYTVDLEFGTVNRNAEDWRPLGALTLKSESSDEGPFQGELIVRAVDAHNQTFHGVIQGQRTRAFIGESTTAFDAEDRFFRVYATPQQLPVDIDFNSLDIYIAG